MLDGSMIGMLVLYGVGGTAATAATLVYHTISLWVPAVWGTIAFVVLQKTKKRPIVLRHPTGRTAAEEPLMYGRPADVKAHPCA